MDCDKNRIAELVTEIQKGNKGVFDELYRLTSQRAYFVALEFLKNDQDAEDILQESYIKALDKINSLDKPESFSSWLNQIVANKSKDFLKNKKPMLFEEEEHEVFEVIPDENTDFRPEESLDQDELQRAVREVLDELSEEKRACVLMMYYEEMSIGEIAQTLEIPEGTVKTRLFSARKDLKNKFEKRGITSLYSVAPIGVVVWMLRRSAATVSASFAGSAASAEILSGITVASEGAAAAAGTATAATAATTTATTATAASTAAGSAAAGSGIAAKIAALSAAQKVIAGVSVAAVVTGSTAGVATVVMNRETEVSTTSTSYVEEYTTAPSFETTLAVEAIATVEVSETETESQTSETRETVSETGKMQTTAAATVKQSETAKETSTRKATATKKSTTVKSTTAVVSTTRKVTTTEETTEEETTKKETTTKKATTTKKVTTTQPTTAKPTTTKPTTTKETTTEATTAAQAKIIVNYTIADEAETPDPYIIYVDAGSTLDVDTICNKIMDEYGYYDFMMTESNLPSEAEAGAEYTCTGVATR